MKLTLIRPNMGHRHGVPYEDEGRMEPLALGVLAAATPADVEVTLIDDRVESIPYDEPTDLVGMSAETTTARRAYEISGGYRRRGVPTVLGGFHPTLAPEESAAHADAIVIGDGEACWPTLVEDTRQGRLQPVYRASPPGRPQSGLFPRRDLFRGKGYLPVSLVQFSRGCRYRCSFCAVSRYFHSCHSVRPVAEVVEEIERQDRRLIFFVDDNITANPEALKSLCRALIPMRLHWVSQGTVDMARDPELMALMIDSGCLGHVVGFESITAGGLRWMRKAPNLRHFDHYEYELGQFREFGMQLWAAFTIGHDCDTLETIRDTLAFALENKFCFAAFNVLVPYPNTDLYRSLATEGRLLYDGAWWLHPDYRFNYAAFVPKHMTPEDLTAAGFEARSRFNTIGSIASRALDLKTNMRSLYRFGTYLRFNPLFRREVFRKHGMRLGYAGGPS